MTDIRRITIDDLSLQAIESGPIRAMIEAIYIRTLDAAERENGLSLLPAEEAALHDRVVLEMFLGVLLRGRAICREDADWAVSREGQRGLRRAMEETIGRLVRRRAAPARCCGRADAPSPMDPVALPGRSLRSKLRKFLFP